MTRRPTRRARGAQQDGLTGDLFAGLDEAAGRHETAAQDEAAGAGTDAASGRLAVAFRDVVHDAAVIDGPEAGRCAGQMLPRTPAQMLALLDDWQVQGMLRYIDVALARFLAQEVLPGRELDPEAASTLALVLLGAALCSAQLGQGHACLDLQAVTADPAGAPGVPVADVLSGLDAPCWQAALQAWPQLVSCRDLDGAGRVCMDGQMSFGAVPGGSISGAGRFAPLVLAHGRLYLHRLWRCEQDVQQGILQRLGRDDAAAAHAIMDARHAAAASHGADAVDDVQAARLQQALDVLFPSALPDGARADAGTLADPAGDGARDTAAGHPAGGKDPAVGRLAVGPGAAAIRSPRGDRRAAGRPADWQKIACALASRQRFGLITGGPGTGKTTTVLRLLALLQWQALAERGTFLRIGLAAPTGKAAARLSGSIAGAIGRLPLDGVPQGEAIRAAIPHAVSTLHRLLGSRPDSRHFRHDARSPLRLDVLVIDEASMIDLEMMAAVMRALPASARLILLGDKDQLASVEAGAILGELCARAQQGHYWPATATWVNGVTREVVAPALQDAAGTPLDQSICMLRHSHRFGADSGIGRLAALVNAGDVQGVARLWREAGHGSAPGAAGPVRAGGNTGRSGTPEISGVPASAALDGMTGGDQVPDIARYEVDASRRGLRELVIRGRGEQPVGYAHYLQVMRQHQPTPDADRATFDAWAQQVLQAHGRFQLLCALRQGHWGVDHLNRQIAVWLQGAGLLAASEGWYAGRPVMITHNDYELRLMNGDVGITLAGPEGRLRVVFPDDRGGVRWVLPSRLQAADTVFAMTVHKAQGSEFDHAALAMPEVLSPVLTRELVYTAITRARRFFTLVGPAADEEAGIRGLDGVMAQAIRRQVRRASGLMAGALSQP